MSAYFSAYPWMYLPRVDFSTAMGAARATRAAQTVAHTTTAATNAATSATATAATSATAGTATSATAGTAASATAGTAATGTAASTSAATAAVSPMMTALATAAVPVAVAVLAVLAAGMTLDIVKQTREMKRNAEVRLPTVFSDLKALEQAIFAYDEKGECEMYYDEERDMLTVRYALEDYVFQRDPETGFYQLHVKNVAGTCRSVVDSVNAIQLAYMEAVRSAVRERIYSEAQKQGWEIESDVEDGEDRVITLLV